MKNDSLYTYLPVEQSLALKNFIRHPALTTEGLSFVGFVSLSDYTLKDVLIRYIQSEVALKIEVVLNTQDLEEMYRQGKSDTIYIIPCLLFPEKELIQFVYPTMQLYRDFIFERKLKHIYVGDAGFTASASEYMPDLFLINNVVLLLKNERAAIEKDLAAAKALPAGKMTPPESFRRIHSVSWLDQRPVNVADKKIKESELSQSLAASSSLHTRIFVSIHLAALHITLQEFEAAESYLKTAGEIAEKIQSRSFIRAIRLQRAFLYLNRTEWKKATDLLQEFIADTEAEDSIEQVFAARTTLGYSLIRQNRMEEAFQQLTEVRNKSREAGIHSMEACASLYVGDIYAYRSNHSQARICYRRALAIYTSRMSIPQFAHCLVKLGHSFLHTDDRAFARMYFRQALSLYRSQGLNQGKAMALYGMAETYLGGSENAKAHKWLREAGALFRKEQDGPAFARTMRSLGIYYLCENRLPDAESALLEARNMLHLLNDSGLDYPQESMLLHAAFGDLYTREKKHAEAEICLKKALEYFLQAGDQRNILVLYKQMGLLSLSDSSGKPGDSSQNGFQVLPTSAYAYLQQALSLAQELHSLSSEWSVRQALSTYYLRQGQQEEALKQQSQAEGIRQILE